MNQAALIRWAVFVYACLHVLNYFFPTILFFGPSIVVLFYILIQAMRTMPRLNVAICGGLFLLGLLLMIYGGAPIERWIEGLTRNGLLIALFVCSPMLHLPFSYEDYQLELKNVAKSYMHTMIPFYFLIAVPTHIFAALTGFAAFAIMYNLFLETSRLYNSEEIFIASLARSYSTSGFWGTSWVSVMLVVNELGIPWYKIIPVGMIFTVVSIGINLISIKIKMIKDPGRYPRLSPEKDTVVHWRRVFMMLFLAVVTVLIILVINIRTGWKLLAIVPLVAFFFPALVALFQKKIPEYKSGLHHYYEKSLFKSKNEVTLFTAAGFLATALDVSGVSQKIPELIPEVLTSYPPLLIAALMLLIIIPGMIGIHPVATGTTLVAAIVPASIGLSVPTFAWTIICAWLLSNLLSPFSALNLTLAGLSNRSSWSISLGLSWKYVVVCLAIYSVMVSIIGPLL